jgi:hypothetical protein
MFRFCLSGLLVLALSWQGTVLAQTPGDPDATAPAEAVSASVESGSPLGAGLAIPTVAVLTVLAVLLGTTVTQECNLDSAGCGGPTPITATATGTR